MIWAWMLVMSLTLSAGTSGSEAESTLCEPRGLVEFALRHPVEEAEEGRVVLLDPDRIWRNDGQARDLIYGCGTRREAAQLSRADVSILRDLLLDVGNYGDPKGTFVGRDIAVVLDGVGGSVELGFDLVMDRMWVRVPNCKDCQVLYEIDPMSSRILHLALRYYPDDEYLAGLVK